MKILYDAKGFDAPYSGVAFYLIEMIRHLPSVVEPDIAIAVTNNPEMSRAPFFFKMTKINLKKYSRKLTFKWKAVIYRWLIWLFPDLIPAMEFKNEVLFRKKIKKMDFDVLHLTGAHYYGLSWRKVLGKKPIVITVHDLIPELLEGNTDIIKQRRTILSCATCVIAVSGKTKKDLVDFYSVPSDKITVVYHGWTEWTSKKAEPIFPDKRYILYVGARCGSKRFTFFLKAIAPYILSHPGLNVVCTGKPFDGEELMLIDNLKMSGRIVAQFIPNEQMYSLYKNAELFVYPSGYEGFGIPILDAFHAGCPVVLSNCSCFPEIGADAALYFSDGDEEGLRACIDRIISDGHFREELIKKGFARAEHLTWTLAANKTAQVYEKAISSFKANSCHVPTIDSMGK